MKRFILLALTIAVVLAPSAAQAKPHHRPARCMGSVTVDYSHHKKVVDRRLVCLGQVKPVGRHQFSAETYR